jgi:ABC-type phosphonate transport system ATPase subunit
MTGHYGAIDARHWGFAPVDDSVILLWIDLLIDLSSSAQQAVLCRLEDLSVCRPIISDCASVMTSGRVREDPLTEHTSNDVKSPAIVYPAFA